MILSYQIEAQKETYFFASLFASYFATYLTFSFQRNKEKAPVEVPSQAFQQVLFLTDKF